MSALPHERFLTGWDPQFVLVPPRVAVWLDDLAGSARVDLRGRKGCEEIVAVLSAIHAARSQIEYYDAVRAARKPPPELKSSERGDCCWLDSASVAGVLGCGAANVRRMGRDGLIRGARRVGPQWRFPREAVEAYAATRAKGRQC